jgi:hypothetical protein
LNIYEFGEKMPLRRSTSVTLSLMSAGTFTESNRAEM